MATTTLEQNFETAKRHLVIDSITHLQDTISICYGVGEHPSTNFSDPLVSETFYKVNELACKLFDEIDKMKGEEDD